MSFIISLFGSDPYIRHTPFPFFTLLFTETVSCAREINHFIIIIYFSFDTGSNPSLSLSPFMLGDEIYSLLLLKLPARVR